MSLRMTYYTLPVEIIEQIIDQLRGECSTLLNCALTCRDLFPRAIEVLYTAIRIQNRAAYDTFLRVRFSVKTRDAFLQTEDLEFSDRREKRLWEKTFLQGMIFTFAGVTFPNLGRLAFRSEDRIQEPFILHFRIPGSFTKTFSSVRALTLDGVQFYTLRDFVRLVCALPHLEELYLMGRILLKQLPPRQVVMTEATGSQLKLQQFCLSTNSVQMSEEALYMWLMCTPTVQAQTLQVLHLDSLAPLYVPEWRYYDTLARLQERLGSSLTDLQIPTKRGGASR
ncbi:hypothetical protein DAEQUDRAFT_277590 [Daedalea quercina L-15889]|uniref:F-box domain-containing protein n=1 Tax=Daedalea quercina L-15889 TaxID=1314783 RepID=A0A165Q835_9APHY|nr:hypothetical protein DAEQUDRAFT_277590 [Daedalea quercina L-15889]